MIKSEPTDERQRNAKGNKQETPVLNHAPPAASCTF